MIADPSVQAEKVLGLQLWGEMLGTGCGSVESRSYPVPATKKPFAGLFEAHCVDFSTAGVLVLKSSGASINAGEFTAVWTNPATGKSIVIHGSEMFMNSAPIDNGDGTISFVGSSNGTYIVKDAHGAPISIDAGRVVSLVTLDATTGQFRSVELLSVNGNQSDTPADSSCATIVPALT